MENTGKVSIHDRKQRFRELYGHEWELFYLVRQALLKAGDWSKEAETKLRDRLRSPHVTISEGVAARTYNQNVGVPANDG